VFGPHISDFPQRARGGVGENFAHCWPIHISGTAEATGSSACSLCGAFDAAFAKLLCPLVNT